MINKIRTYIDDAFAEVSQTKKTIDLKDELFANMCEKYNDRIASGKSEQEAYEYVLKGVGDIRELVESVREPYPLAPMSPSESRKRALRLSFAVAMYILSPMMVIFFSEVIGNDVLGIFAMFALIAGATGLIVYNSMTKPEYLKSDDTLVEEFKEWRVNSENERQAYKALSSAYWSVVTAIFLIFSFITGMWHISWIIFIMGSAVENVIKGFVQLRRDKDA
jgi:hypothetical protein